MTEQEVRAKLSASPEYADANGGALYAVASLRAFREAEGERCWRLTDGVGVFESSGVVGRLELLPASDGGTELRLTFALGRVPLGRVYGVLGSWMGLGLLGGGLLLLRAYSSGDQAASLLVFGLVYGIVTLFIGGKALVIALTVRDHRARISRALGIENKWH